MSTIMHPYVLAFRISEEMHGELQEEARAQHERMATISRSALREYLDERRRLRLGVEAHAGDRFVIKKEKQG